MDTTTLDRKDILTHVNRAKLYELRGRQNNLATANSKPLPGPALDAFTTSAIKIGNRLVEKVVPARFAILQAIDSPVIQLIENAKRTDKAEVNFTPEQMWAICYLFTTDARETWKQFKAKGKDWLAEQAEEHVGSQWDFTEVDLVMMAVMEQLKRHVETFVKFVAEVEEKGQITFFRETPDSKVPA